MTNKQAQTIIGNIPIYGDDCYSITEYQEAKAMAIQALEQSPCEDAISREEVLDILKAEWVLDKPIEEWSVYRDVVDLPSVTPIRPKGEWIEIIDEETAYSKTWHYGCSKCGKHNTCLDDSPNFCPNCGADMRGERE